MTWDAPCETYSASAFARVHAALRRDNPPAISRRSWMVACANLDDSSWPRRAIARLYADVIGGVTTFFTMAYIVVVNPGILSTPGTGMPFSGALTATVLVACSMTLLMGLYARLPFAVAPGMGLNAFFAFTHRAAEQGAVADRARHGLLGRRAVPAGLGDAAARAHRAGDSGGAAVGGGRRHRPAADVHRPAERRAHRRRSGDAGAAWARSITARRSCCSASSSRRR